MTNKPPILKAPFPYPGGKSRVADEVWSRLGDVDNYVEPFAGSLAVLLRRPDDHFRSGYRVETVNDANHYLVNFWRAVKNDPDAVAEFADSPVLEADLHARHKWLVRSEHAAGWRKRMAEDPEHFDAKVAGWWVWGQCCWIGGAWCNDGFVGRNAMPQVDVAHGVHRGPRAEETQGRPQLTDAFDIWRGVNASPVGSTQIRDLSGANGAGSGVHANKVIGVADRRREWLTAWMRRLADRLRLVRTCYGHWSRICDSDSTLTRLGTTGVFLDPPYPTERGDTGAKSRDDSLYINDKTQDLNALRDEVLAWCRKWGQDKRIRVVVCGYEGDGYADLIGEGWAETQWEAGGGYANQRRGGKGKSENAKRERIWWSPGVPSSVVPDLFAGAA